MDFLMVVLRFSIFSFSIFSFSIFSFSIFFNIFAACCTTENSCILGEYCQILPWSIPTFSQLGNQS